MRKGTLRTLINQQVAEAGNDKAIGFEKAAEMIQDLMEKKTIKPEDFSIRALFEELCDADGAVDRSNAGRVAEAITTSAFPTISKVIISKSIIDAYNLYAELGNNLVSEAEATRTTTETVAGFTSPEGLDMRPEGMAYTETTFGEKDYGVVMADFGRIISLTREAIFDDRTGQLLTRARQIGELGGQHRTKMIVQTLEVAPRTAFGEKTGASKAFIYKGAAKQVATVYADTHVALDGVVNDNLVASNALVDYSDIEGALLMWDKMVDEAGNPIEVNANTILVPNALKVKLWTVLNTGLTGFSATDKVPIVSPYGKGGFQDFTSYSSRYLNDTTTWYIGDFKKQLLWLWVFRPETATQTSTSESAFSNQIVMRYRFNYHGGCGHTDYRYIIKCTS
jgi:hypothetical protein